MSDTGSGSNPYLTVGSPSYAAPLMNWQGLLNPQSQQQQKPGQPAGGPAQSPGNGSGPGGQTGNIGYGTGVGPYGPIPATGPQTQAQQQMAGLGGFLKKMFMGGGQGVAGQPPAGAPQSPPVAGQPNFTGSSPNQLPMGQYGY